MWRQKCDRIRFGKDVRIAVHAKCHGHCAYCGTPITMREMQIDHVTALDRGGDNSLGNLLPSCRQCNFYKGTWTLDCFRENLLSTLPRTTNALFNVRLALKYGIIVQGKGWDGKFYFEKLAEKEADREKHES